LDCERGGDVGDGPAEARRPEGRRRIHAAVVVGAVMLLTGVVAVFRGERFPPGSPAHAASNGGTVGLSEDVQSLIDQLRSGAIDEAKNEALEALVKVDGPEAQLALLNASRAETDPKALALEAAALGEIGGRQEQQALERALTSQSASVRTAALRGLGELDRGEVLDLLAKTIESDQDAPTRALGAAHGSVAREALIKALAGDANATVRAASARALGETGSPVALGMLMSLLTSGKDAAVRPWAAAALGKFNDSDARSALIKVLESDKDVTLRSAAAHALGEIGGSVARDALIKALQTDSYSGTRAFAAYALGQIGGTTARDALITALQSEDSAHTRSFAAYALGEIGGPDARQVLLDALQGDADRDVRMRAAVSLGMVGGPGVRDALVKASWSDSSSDVRATARAAAHKLR